MYNRIVSVELLLNFAWLVLSGSLVIFWVSGLRFAHAPSRQPGLKVQMLALAMLILVLLPVISMTDDVQALTAAEIEHVTRRADLLPNSDQPADLAVSLEAMLFQARQAFDLHTFARLEPPQGRVQPQCGSVRQMANRPPPIAV